MDETKFIETMTALCEIYNKKSSELVFGMYYEIFKPYTHEQFTSAALRCIRERKYSDLPKPSEILEYLEGSAQDKSLVAWLQVKEAIKKGGWIASVQFEDATIAPCINELGGWMWLCSQEIQQLPFIEKRFRETYQLFKKRSLADDAHIVGFVEQANREKGIEEKNKILYIGKQKQVERIDGGKEK